MAEVFNAVAIGDLHLDKKRLHDLFGAGVTQLQLNEVRKVMDYAIDRGIPHAILLGDIADEPRLSDPSQIALINLLKEYDGRIHIHIILGNHDVEQRTVHALGVIETLALQGFFTTVHIYTKPTKIKLDGVPVDMLPFPATQPLRKNSICVAHLERPGAVRDNGMKIGKDHGVPEPEGDNVWVIGHLHTPQHVGLSWFAGTLYQTNFGESLPKKFLEIKARVKGGKLQTKIEFKDHDPAFKLFNLEVNSIDDLAQIEDNLLYKYKVFHAADVELPLDWLTKHPNVVDHVPFKDKAELKDLLQPERVAYKITDGLPQYLTSQKGMDKRAVRRAMRHVKKAGKRLGIGV